MTRPTEIGELAAYLQRVIGYLGWQHPDERFQNAVLQRQVMSVLARTFGGLRTGDEHALTGEVRDRSGAVQLGARAAQEDAPPRRQSDQAGVTAWPTE